MTFSSFNLGQLYNVYSGLSKPREEFGFGYPFVTFKDVFYNYFLPNELSELANATEKEIQSCSVKRGDIFLTRTSETMDELGMSSVALKDYPNATFNGFTKRLRLKEGIGIDIDPVFMGYYMRSKEIRDQIYMHSSMTTRASLNSTAINSIEISIPEYKYQLAIGEILKSFDDKIEFNYRINQTIEKITSTLFKKYFVEDLKEGRCSSGIKKVTLADLMDFVGGSQPPASEFIGHEKEGYIRLIQIRDYESDKYLTYVPKTSKLRLCNEKDIMIARYGASVARVCYGLIGAYNVALVRVLPKEKYYTEFLRAYLKSDECQEALIGMSARSVQAGFNKDDFKNIKLSIPAHVDTFERYEDEASVMVEKILHNKNENKILIQLRDILLPKLMSGDIPSLI